MMQIIDLALAKHEFVEVANIPGNHDPEAARAMPSRSHVLCQVREAFDDILLEAATVS